MERRVLLAALLSGVVIILWFSLFAPPRQPAGPSAAPPAMSTPSATQPGSAAAPVATPQPQQPAAPAVPAMIGQDAAEVAVGGDGWHGAVNPRGGVLTSLILSEYKDGAGAPLELVLSGVAAPLSAGAPGPWNDELYQVERGNGRIDLRWSDGKGNWVEKHLSVGGGKYALEVEVRAGGEPARAGVVVAAGLQKGLKPEQQGRFGGSDAAVRVAGKLERVNAAKLDGPKLVRGPIDFAGVEDQYFLVALLPSGGVDEVRIAGVSEGLVGAGTTGRPQVRLPEVVVVGSGGVVRGTLYAGAKERSTLVGYGRGLEETLSFGIFGFLSVAFLAALRWIHSFVGNWGVAIIVLTAGIRLLLFPLNHKSAVQMKRMQALQPKMKAIQDRYQERAKKDPNVRARMNQEVMALYKQEGVNPMGGCLPMLVQLPILWALYSLFAYAIELRQAPFVFWIKDLAAKDPTYITPILMTASMVLQQRMAPQMGDPAQRRMFMLMPFIFGFMFMSFPSGLVLYWLINNIFTIGQQVLTEKMMAGAEPAK
ncbi:MAG TPA: membrane protein insertase YidC [Thermoanaerobaculaceae bacterium]|nr:membrane protein insertase YidC [Thermoanaerobaculaceae bacterium]